jgi:hypothetical protein
MPLCHTGGKVRGAGPGAQTGPALFVLPQPLQDRPAPPKGRVGDEAPGRDARVDRLPGAAIAHPAARPF